MEIFIVYPTVRERINFTWKILSSILLFPFNDFYSYFNSYKGRFRVNTASLRIGLSLSFKNLGSCLEVTVETYVLIQRNILFGNKLL